MNENALILVGELSQWRGALDGFDIVLDAEGNFAAGADARKRYLNTLVLATGIESRFSDDENVLIVDSVESAVPYLPALLQAERGGIARVIGGVLVRGRDVDAQTRCRHYHSAIDIIAIRFPCCEWFSPCAECHAETSAHTPRLWGADQRDAEAVLCGECGKVMTIHAYQAHDSRCPFCDAQFNPGCKGHWHLYFEE